MLVSDVPSLAAHNAPADRSIHFEGHAVTYREFADRCRQLSRALDDAWRRAARASPCCRATGPNSWNAISAFPAPA